MGNDHHPFGMLLVDRNWDVNYRYGFNGQELEIEANDNFSSINFGNRTYDTRIGRWQTPDKYEAKFSATSTYAFCLNNPLYLVDKNGDDVFIFDSQNKLVAVIKSYTATDIAVQLSSVSVPDGFPVLNLEKSGHDAYFIDFSADITDALGFKDPSNPADLSVGIELVIFMHGPNKYVPMMFAQVYAGVTTPEGLGSSTVTPFSGSVGYADLYNFTYTGGEKQDTYPEFSDYRSWEGQNLVTTDVFKPNGKGLSGLYFKFGPTNLFTKQPYWAGCGKSTHGFQIKEGVSTSKFISEVGREVTPNVKMQEAINSWNKKHYNGESNSAQNNETNYLEKTPDKVELIFSQE